MPLADLEQPGLPDHLVGELPDAGLHLLGDLRPLLLKFPEKKAHEYEGQLLFVAILDVILHRRDVVGAEQRVIWVGVHDVHHGDDRQQQRGNRVGGLLLHALYDQHHKRYGDRAVEAEHDPAEQESPDPREQYDAEYRVAQIGIDEYSAPDEAYARFFDDKREPLGRDDHVRQHGDGVDQVGEEQRALMVFVVGDFTDVGDIVHKYQ